MSPDGRKTVLKIFKTVKTNGICLKDSPTGILCARGNQLFVKTADEWLELSELQLSGKKRMQARDFLNGMREIEQYRVE